MNIVSPFIFSKEFCIHTEFKKIYLPFSREKRKHSLDVQIAREDEFSDRLSNRANFRSS